MLPGLKRLRFDGQPTSEQLTRLQDAADAAFRPIVAALLLDGRLISSVALAAAANVVSHGLGRAPVGWFLVAPQAAATVFETLSARSAKTLTLTASATVTTGLWVF